VPPSLRLLAAQARHRLRRRLPWLAGALGAVVLFGGVLVLFTTVHEARSAFLLAVGLALVLVAFLGGRVPPWERGCGLVHVCEERFPCSPLANGRVEPPKPEQDQRAVRGV
jgi:hypothetical protein